LAPFEIVDFDSVPGTPCPCGVAHRAFTAAADFPATIHRTHISHDARLHYHQRLTEVYYFLKCEPGAQMELNTERIEVHAGMAILIRPLTRHRAIGKMQVLIVALPKFDPSDEWFD
jgi:mannose-6-phosphate isomerase-like protein (cupin superfamily)